MILHISTLERFAGQFGGRFRGSPSPISGKSGPDFGKVGARFREGRGPISGKSGPDCRIIEKPISATLGAEFGEDTLGADFGGAQGPISANSGREVRGSTFPKSAARLARTWIPLIHRVCTHGKQSTNIDESLGEERGNNICSSKEAMKNRIALSGQKAYHKQCRELSQ